MSNLKNLPTAGIVVIVVILALFALAGLLWGAYAKREVGGTLLWLACVVLVLQNASKAQRI